MSRLRLRYLGPVVLIALCLVTLCTFTAVSLFRQQATVTRVLRENVVSRQAAVEMEECLTDLVALEDDRVEAVAVLHDRLRVHLAALAAVADQPEERLMHDRLTAAFAAYLALWESLPPAGAPDHDEARRTATRVLETGMLTPCREFKGYNARRIEASAGVHERVLAQLAWGMAGVGGLGGAAGLILGYGVARGLARSIGRLRVQIRDAAGKLAGDLPEIVLTGEGDFPSLHAEVADLTGRIERTVRTLQQREYEVLRAEQLAAVGQLAAGVAHEVRNPLASIKMLVQAGLEDGGLPADDLRVIEAEVRRTERSLQSFLDFARPPKSERRPTDLGPVIAGVVGLIRGRADRQRVAVRTDAAAGGVVLTADGERVRQVLVNLCLNALDAMPAGGTLTVAVRPTPAGGVAVAVEDTGPGIAREMAGRLFQPFASTKETGVGLGLVISRRIAEDHGGTILAANRPEGGAAFTVVLPPPLRPD